MRFLYWNASGLKKGSSVASANAQAKADWLLSYLGRAGAFCLGMQETHCDGLDDFPQAMRDICDLYTVIHSPPMPGDPYAGVALVISREFQVEPERVMLGGRVLVTRVTSVL